MDSEVQFGYILFILLLLGSCKKQSQTNTYEASTQKHNSKVKEDEAETRILKTSSRIHGITRDIVEDQQGNLWFATFDGMFKYDGHTLTKLLGDRSSNRFFSVLEDHNKNLWFASVGGGVYYGDGASLLNFTTKDGLAGDRVLAIYEDSNKMIWFGTETGISRYDGKAFQNFFSEKGRRANDVSTIVEDKTGRMWFGSRNGIRIYDGTSTIDFKNANNESFGNVRYLYKDSKGDVWIGGLEGLWRYHGNAIVNYSKDPVGYILEDKHQNIWVSRNKGYNKGWDLVYYKGAVRYDQVPSVHKIHSGEVMIFGIEEDQKGNIWFGTLDGARRYDGKSIVRF